VNTLTDIARRREALREFVPPIEWPAVDSEIRAIRRLKTRRRAAVLAHNYQRPVIFHGIADVTGDSLALARGGGATDAPVLVVCGVRFMAETVKVMNPGRKVLLPASGAGCSLAASITAEDVRALRRAHPGVPIVAYVNTTAEVKAESDVCCTSANVAEVVAGLGAPRVLVVPDGYLARYAAAQTGVTVIPWEGRCEVHERFRAEDVRELRRTHPGVMVLVHPECSPEVAHEADYVGSTSGMIRKLESARPATAALVTECSMSDNVGIQLPGVRLVRLCGLCPYMQLTTLATVRSALETGTEEIRVEPDVARGARRALERMFALGLPAAS
jgi:quinolinate synthase